MKQQIEAIFGPPGTGKTRELVRLAGETDGKSLFLSFTKAAAAEAVSRLPDSGNVKASTIHSLAFNSLNLNRASVVDGKKMVEFGKSTGIPFKGEDGSDELQEGDEYATVLAYANNHQTSYADAFNKFGRPGTAKRFELFVTQYLQWKQAFGYMDFDDMLMRFIEEETTVPYENLFLDEAQDCSPLQWRVIDCLTKRMKSVTVAGDDDQAIFEWNGADPHGMVKFIEERDGTMRVLGQSHRVPSKVLAFAKSKTTDKMGRRVNKEFKPRTEPGRVERYGDIWNVDLRGLYNNGGGMMLVRDRWRLDEVRRALNRDMVPYEVMGGTSPWTSKIAQALRRGEKPEIPPSWREFYRQADLRQPVNISLSTIHQAKGRESKRVVLDLLLSQRVTENLYRDRDAELRVMYVGLTRTFDELIVCGENPLIC